MSRDRDVPFDRYWTRRHSDRTVREAVLHPRRRLVLYYLRERSAPVEVEELADRIAAWERGRGGVGRAREDVRVREDVTADEREAVVASLRRHHIPHLAERGVVTYDPDRDRVAYDTDDSRLAMLLANDPRTSVAWHVVFLALTGVSAVLLGLVWLNVGPFAEVGAVTVAGVVVALFAAASAVYWYDVSRWRRDHEGEPPDFLVTLGDDVVERTPDDGESDADESESDDADE